MLCGQKKCLNKKKKKKKRNAKSSGLDGISNEILNMAIFFC